MQDITHLSWEKINGKISQSTYERSVSRLNKKNTVNMYSNKIPIQTEKISTSEISTFYLSQGNQVSEYGAHHFDVTKENELRKTTITKFNREDGNDMIGRLSLPTKYYIPEPMSRPKMTRLDEDDRE